MSFQARSLVPQTAVLVHPKPPQHDECDPSNPVAPVTKRSTGGRRGVKERAAMRSNTAGPEVQPYPGSAGGNEVADGFDLVVELRGRQARVGAEEEGGVHDFVRAGERGAGRAGGG